MGSACVLGCMRLVCGVCGVPGITNGLRCVSACKKCRGYLSIALGDCAKATQGFHVCVHDICREPRHIGAYMCVVCAVRCVSCVWHTHSPVWRAEPGNGGEKH